MNSEAQSTSANTEATSSGDAADLEKADLDTVYQSLATSTRG